MCINRKGWARATRSASQQGRTPHGSGSERRGASRAGGMTPPPHVTAAARRDSEAQGSWCRLPRDRDGAASCRRGPDAGHPAASPRHRGARGGLRSREPGCGLSLVAVCADGSARLSLAAKGSRPGRCLHGASVSPRTRRLNAALKPRTGVKTPGLWAGRRPRRRRRRHGHGSWGQLSPGARSVPEYPEPLACASFIS